MGRYDKIQVYDNNAWHIPKQIRVYHNGAWQDLGRDDSYSTKEIKVKSGENFIRCTLNRRDETVISDQYIQGTFNLLPANGYCRHATKADWYFRATIERTRDDSDVAIFYCGNGNLNGWGRSYIVIQWLANGKIRVTTAYNGVAVSMTSTNAVAKNTAVYLNVYSNRGSTMCYIDFDGVTTSGNLTSTFNISNAINIVGESGLKVRGMLSACGTNYVNANTFETHVCSFNANTASDTDWANYTNVNHVEHSSVIVHYE